MTELYNALCQRWYDSFNEFDTLDAHRQAGPLKKYTATMWQIFDLENYSPNRFSPEERLRDEKPDGAGEIAIYSLDTQNRPVHVAFEYSRYPAMQSEGLYHYSDSLVEYIQFYINTRSPQVLSQLHFKNGKKMLYTYLKTDRPDLSSLNERHITVNIHEYVYDGDRIDHANCFYVTAGYGAWQCEEKYSYTPEGKLDTITRLHPDGRRELLYARRTRAVSPEKLINTLIPLLANAVIDALLSANVEQPLAMLELNYQRVNNYLPFPKPISQPQIDELLANLYPGEDIFESLWLRFDGLIPIDDSGFERPFQELVQLIDKKKDFDLGTSLLRKAALMLTQDRLQGKIAVTPDFVAYAIDWSMEMEEFPGILLECGLPEKTLNEWKEKGWLAD